VFMQNPEKVGNERRCSSFRKILFFAGTTFGLTVVSLLDEECKKDYVGCLVQKGRIMYVLVFKEFMCIDVSM